MGVTRVGNTCVGEHMRALRHILGRSTRCNVLETKKTAIDDSNWRVSLWFASMSLQSNARRLVQARLGRAMTQPETETLDAALVEALGVLRVATDEDHRTALQSVVLIALSTPAGAHISGPACLRKPPPAACKSSPSTRARWWRPRAPLPPRPAHSLPAVSGYNKCSDSAIVAA